MNDFDKEFEDAIRFVAEKFSSEKDLTKPTLFHSVRVGVFLYQGGYGKETCIGGILHDVIEDTGTGEEELKSKFGHKVAELVRVNSKDTSIDDKKVRTEAMIRKCATHSRAAAVIKAADILDNIRYYRKTKHAENLATMIERGKLLLREKNVGFQDKVFSELNKETT